MARVQDEYPLVLFQIKGETYAVTSEHVQSMTKVPEVIPIPHSPAWVRGLINLRGEVLPLVDLRTRLGLASVPQEIHEFTRMLSAREQDHRNWLNELEASVREERPFTLTTDPHQCAFGKWYDQFMADKTGIDNTSLSILRQFDEPHKLIHGVAEKVARQAAQNEFDAAHELIDSTRDNELVQMIQLFRSTAAHFSETNHEIALVLETSGFNFAIAVDSVEAVEFLDEATIQDLPISSSDEQRQPLSSKLGRRTKDGSVVQILEVEKLCARQEMEKLAGAGSLAH